MLQTRRKRPQGSRHRRTIELLAQCHQCKRNFTVVGTLWGSRVTAIEPGRGFFVSEDQVFCSCGASVGLYRMNSSTHESSLQLLTSHAPAF